MTKPRPVGWDPSWDDDWVQAQETLDHEIEQEHPHSPAEAVEFYRFGFAAAKTHPTHEWPEVEQELYQDYMSGAPEPGEERGEQEVWEEGRVWAHRGFQAGQAYRKR